VGHRLQAIQVGLPGPFQLFSPLQAGPGIPSCFFCVFAAGLPRALFIFCQTALSTKCVPQIHLQSAKLAALKPQSPAPPWPLIAHCSAHPPPVCCFDSLGALTAPDCGDMNLQRRIVVSPLVCELILGPDAGLLREHVRVYTRPVFVPRGDDMTSRAVLS